MIGALLDSSSTSSQAARERSRGGASGHAVSRWGRASVLGIREGGEDVAEALIELERLGIAGAAGAAWIRTAEEVAARVPRPDLVWSGPMFPGCTPATRAACTRSCWALRSGRSGRAPMPSSTGRAPSRCWRGGWTRGPICASPCCLNIQRGRGDTTTADQVVRRFADHFWTKDWPGRPGRACTTIRASLELDGRVGVLHAKAVVADDEAVFVTSANLTEAALDRNIEIGLVFATARWPPACRATSAC